MGGDDRSWERVAAAAREGEVLWGLFGPWETNGE
jgi:hypothetical protein